MVCHVQNSESWVRFVAMFEGRNLCIVFSRLWQYNGDTSWILRWLIILKENYDYLILVLSILYFFLCAIWRHHNNSRLFQDLLNITKVVGHWNECLEMCRQVNFDKMIDNFSTFVKINFANFRVLTIKILFYLHLRGDSLFFLPPPL